MQNQDRRNQAAGFSLADIYYFLLRHRWKIIGPTSAGLLVAALVYFFQQPATYGSEAKLFIRYVWESRLPSGIGGAPQINTPDPVGANILNSEIEIMKSMDLAVQVAEAIGSEKILGKGAGETNRYVAATILETGLTVEVPLHSDILRIVFTHPNREIVQPVLSQLIDAYLRKHVEIHRSGGAFDDVLTQQTDAIRVQLAQTEQELRRAKTNAGVMSIEDSKKAYTEELSKTRRELFKTQAKLAARRAALQERQKLMPAPVEASTNQPDFAMPFEKIKEYRTISGRLQSLRQRERELLTQYFPENSMVQRIREQIVTAEKLKQSLETEYPNLTNKQLPSSRPDARLRDGTDGTVRIAALQARLEVLNTQLEGLTAHAKAVNEIEPAITELQRRKELEETRCRRFSSSLEQARFYDALGAGKMSNISVVQTPTSAHRQSKQLLKTLAMIVGAGFFGGIALAGLCELGYSKHTYSTHPRIA